MVVARSHRWFPDRYTSTCTVSSNNKDASCQDFYRQRLDEIGYDDWMEIDPNDSLVLDNGESILACLLGAGDMMLWDSRTVHCSYPGNYKINEIETPPNISSSNLKEEALSSKTTSKLIRAATLVCMMPAKHISEDILKMRIQAVEQSRTLTHWVNKVAPLGEEHQEHVEKEKACVRIMKDRQQLDGMPRVLLDFNDLTEDQERLVLGQDYYQKR